MGPKLFVVDEQPPAANQIKLAGNFLITTVIEGLAESFALIRKSGFDPAKFLEVMTGSLFAAPVYRNYGAMLLAEKFDPPGFKMPLGLKDNRLVSVAAEEAEVPMPLASLIHDRFITALAKV
jgi:3-hydroxyisobutyrate dehydrogenase-like beta-hydroxyacid dehydrogenase